ncbi:hypothetical protein F511_46345 [Dorcoceras hygrometricum]|uniref:Uncharacterized protein n=1 Tax=Dorcoceras hygrometricum TaxID=472368 RepID=A0A2Z6ZUV6_9LAMI|nr:hypothetical protein F511_46345 [Dorcoceras hygrometricum]
MGELMSRAGHATRPMVAAGVREARRPRVARSCALLDAWKLRAGRAPWICPVRDAADAAAPRRRALDVRPPHMKRPRRRCWSIGVAPLLRDDAHGRARPLRRARFFVGGAAARRPPPRRRSGDVVTAGLNSFRVWFGPIPGSP